MSCCVSLFDCLMRRSAWPMKISNSRSTAFLTAFFNETYQTQNRGEAHTPKSLWSASPGPRIRWGIHVLLCAIQHLTETNSWDDFGALPDQYSTKNVEKANFPAVARRPNYEQCVTRTHPRTLLSEYMRGAYFGMVFCARRNFDKHRSWIYDVRTKCRSLRVSAKGGGIGVLVRPCMPSLINPVLPIAAGRPSGLFSRINAKQFSCLPG